MTDAGSAFQDMGKSMANTVTPKASLAQLNLFREPPLRVLGLRTIP